MLRKTANARHRFMLLRLKCCEFDHHECSSTHTHIFFCGWHEARLFHHNTHTHTTSPSTPSCRVTTPIRRCTMRDDDSGARARAAIASDKCNGNNNKKQAICTEFACNRSFSLILNQHEVVCVYAYCKCNRELASYHRSDTN